MEQNDYCLTLTHHGIKGMKWGVRRTAAQLGHKVFKKRQKPKTEDDDQTSSRPTRKKTMREMSDAELRAAIERARLEQTYAQLQPQTSSRGKRFINTVMNDVVVPAAKDAGRNILRDKFAQLGKKYLGLEDTDAAESAFKKLKRAAEESTAKRTIRENDRWNKEQDAKEADREAKAKADQEAKAKADQEARDKADREAKAKADQEARDKADREAKAKAKTEKETYETSYEPPKSDKSSSSGFDSGPSAKSSRIFYDTGFVDKTEYTSTKSSGSSFVSGLLTSGSSNRSTSSASSTSLISAGSNYIAGLLAAPDDNR